MKTFTNLVTGPDGFTKLSNNESSANILLGNALTSNQHRYLIQKYFDNERTVTLSTIGSMSLTLTAIVSIGATSATLTSNWTYQTCTQLVTFSDGEQISTLFTNGSTTITWQTPTTGASTTAIKTLGVQYYNIPANVSKIKNDTINVGQLKYQPVFLETRQEWDFINFLPYNSDIPQYCFIYNGTIGVFPIPSTTGNIITFNYKSRVPDFSFADYSTGTLASLGAVVGSTAITGSGTNWVSSGHYPTGTNITYYNLGLRIDPPYGDGIWYPILNFVDDTHLTLALPIVNAPNITSATTYTIGQLPLLEEDFQDMLIYGSLMIYYSSIVNDSNKFKMYEALYKSRLELLEDYAGTKQVNVDLGEEPQAINPNLFIYGT